MVCHDDSVTLGAPSSTNELQPAVMHLEPPITPPAPVGRARGLDVARGIMLVGSVAVNTWWDGPAWFEHAPWAGIHPVDVVFPIFVTLTGCGLAYAYGKRVLLAPTLRRIVILIAVGILYNAHVQWAVDGRVDWGTLRLFGVLQTYAVVVCIVALLHLIMKQWWQWLIWTVALAIAVTVALHAFAQRCPGGVMTPTCNPSGLIDPALFGASHIYDGGTSGFEPEGVVTMIGAVVSASAGATMGHILRVRRRPGWASIVHLVGSALAVVSVLVLTTWWVASQTLTMKRLWTPPFALTIGVPVVVALLVLHLLLDSGPWSRWGVSRAMTWPLVALGRNSLLVYFGSHFLSLTLLARPTLGAGSYLDTIRMGVGGSATEPLPLAALAVAVWAAIAGVLHSQKIYLRP